MRFLLPSAVFDQHIVLLGKTRSGKSSAMRLMVEHLLDRKKPVCIVDPKGDWWGLKSSADGKHAGYPIVIFGGEHGDVPLNSRSGGAVAELAATGNRPCIIDLGGWMPGARTEFWIDFASKFFLLHRGQRWLAIDEVHNFCPKGKLMDPKAATMLHWANRLASEGLGKGIALIAASQRPQKVHNDFLTSCETLVGMRVIHKADRKAFDDWIEGCGDWEIGSAEEVKQCAKETDHEQVPGTGFCRCRKEMYVVESVASMKRGEGWVWSPEAEFGPKRVQFPKFSTYDSFKAQGAAPAKLRGWADVDLAEVTKKLEAAVKEAEANDPKKLQARIRELETLQKQQERIIASGVVMKPARIIQTDDKAVDRAVRPLRAMLEEAMKILVKVTATGFDGAAVKAEDIKKAMDATAKEIARLAKNSLDRRSSEFDLLKKDANNVLRRMKHLMENQDLTVDVKVQHNEPYSVRPQARPSPRVPQGTSNGDLPQGEKEILIALARYDQGVERNTLTVLTGYKRSTRDAYLARLKTKGYWEEKGGRIVTTQEGVNALGSDYNPQPASGQELQAYWMTELPEGEKKILQHLIAANGKPVDRETISAATGFQRSTRDAYISRLAAKQLVTAGRGEVQAAESLFA